jgi:hypothetical protein
MPKTGAPNPGIVQVEMHPTRLETRSPAAWAWCLVLLCVAPLGGTAGAQEDLYGPQAPTDVAYVRAANATEPAGLGVRVADGVLEVLPFAGATGYVAVPPGAVRIDFGGEEFEVSARLGDFLTVVAGPDGVWTIEDTPLQDASRGMLALYNLTERASLDLVVVDGPEVVTDVAPGHQAATPIAEAEAALRVRSSDGDEIDLEPRTYERGVAHAVFVVTGPDGLVVGYEASRLD